MKATIFLNSWACRRAHPVEVIKETPKRYFVRFLGDSCGRFIRGEKYYISKYILTFRNIPNDHICRKSRKK
jgi:hypothetical protein